jgi:hypothetical protein
MAVKSDQPPNFGGTSRNRIKKLTVSFGFFWEAPWETPSILGSDLPLKE